MGDASDSALLLFVDTFTSADTLRGVCPKIAEIPFNSKNKYALTLHETEGDFYNLLIKGIDYFYVTTNQTGQNRTSRPDE